ncbi:MAG: hypothetical protein HZA32_16850 [Opitutae bacterium]|nr:hypothetical protein [Opitutae bacterium]
MRFPHYLRDRFDHPYRLDFDRSRECWTIRVWDGQLPAAYLYAWHVRGQLLRIQDFKVADDLVVPEPPLRHLLRQLLRLRPRTLSYRRRGLGTALLATVVAYADAERIPCLEGDIVERDRAQFPGLPEWYQARGFTLRRDAQGLHFHRTLAMPSTLSA